MNLYGLIFSTWGGSFIVPESWRQIFHGTNLTTCRSCCERFGLRRFSTSESGCFCRGPARYFDIRQYCNQNQMKLSRFGIQHPDLCRFLRSLIAQRRRVLYRAKPASSVARPSCPFFTFQKWLTHKEELLSYVFLFQTMKLVCWDWRNVK